MLFGAVVQINATYTIVILVITLVALTILEVLTGLMLTWAHRHKYSTIFEKLQRELFQLGIISFGLFLFDPSHYSSADRALEYSGAFDFVHLIIMYLGIAIIIQSFIFIKFCVDADRSFLVVMKLDARHILEKYQDILKAGSWDNFIFHKSPVWAPSLQSLRTHIEFKIIQKLFIHVNRLPTEFSFHKYTFHVFKVPHMIYSFIVYILIKYRLLAYLNTFVAETTDISWWTWALLLMLLLLNYLRTQLIDPPLIELVCPMSSAAPGTLTGSLLDQHCVVYYTLCFSAFCMFFLTLYVCIVFIFTNIYFNNLLAKALLLDHIDFEKVGRFGYRRALENIVSEAEDAARRGGSASVLSLSSARILSLNDVCLHKDNAIDEEFTQLGASSSNRQVIQDSSSSPNIADVAEDLERNEIREEQKSAIADTTWYARTRQFLEDSFSKHHDGEQKMLDIKSAFHFRSPRLFFGCCQFSFFLQCFYISLWATQLIPLATRTRDDRVVVAALWILVLTCPIFLNLYLSSQTLNKAILIRCICFLDKSVLGFVCDEMIQLSRATAEIRYKIRKKLEEGKLVRAHWKPFVRGLFSKFDKDSNGHLNKIEFRVMLEELEIYVGDNNFDVLWESIDIDNSNSITWDEMYVLVFPEFQSEFNTELELLKSFRIEIFRYAGAPSSPSPQGNQLLKSQFDHFDTNRSGSIDPPELHALLTKLCMKEVSDRQFHLILSAIRNSKEAGNSISWDQFYRFLYPFAEPVQIPSKPSLKAVNSLKKSFSKPRSIS